MNTKGLMVVAMLMLSLMAAQGTLPANQRINGKLVWEAFESQRQVLQKSSAVIYTDGKSHVKTAYGVVVSEQGHVLTKASEIEGKTPISIRVGRDLFSEVEVVDIDDQWDVAMVKVKSDQVFTPVVLSEDDDVQQGNWVISNGSSSRSLRRVRVGIASAVTREIKSTSSGVVLGVQLGMDKEDVLEIKKVTPKSGAEKAELKEGDVLLSAGGRQLKERADLLQAMKGKNPGESLEIEVLRGKKKIKLDVELMARPGKPKMTRNDQMSGGENSLSKRRDGFPRVLHHDTPLTKSSVGGPLLTLDGICVGMNIARASRVATFAIPARELREMVTRMLK
ncbi:MAG: PDZ domain-containing protein [Verrucomicrobiae bacterium]|nr:PDZ domain-containing protein [Verrucomicrobiae bacterium]NNJ41901.1 PDZ domain-containing protein [Akkermansiaceae bacterium]